jgi:peptidoglycan/xylan/chitin deacetylase (PgdA/CDA1 family)
MLPVLMYHRVVVDGELRRGPFAVEARVFARQLRVLRAFGFTTPPLDDVLAGDAPARSILLTFDDGYLDNFTVALPLLVEHGFRSVNFVVADFTQRRNWWDECSLPTAEAPLLEISHLREMVRHGVDVGSHGITHRKLTSLSAGAIDDELAGSRACLEDAIGVAVRSFAYPYGDVDVRVKERVSVSRYDAAFAVNSGPLSFGADRYEIRRVFIGNRASRTYLAAKLFGVEQTARAMVSAVRG